MTDYHASVKKHYASDLAKFMLKSSRFLFLQKKNFLEKDETFEIFCLMMWGYYYPHYLHHSLAPGREQGENTALPINR